MNTFVCNGLPCRLRIADRGPAPLTRFRRASKPDDIQGVRVPAPEVSKDGAANMSTGNRPLSPHLGVYRWQITMVLSIAHRITGIGLAVGALVLAYWLSAASYGPASFATAQSLLASPFGLLLLLGWTFAFFFHLCNGIRHLAWDTGWGFEIPKMYATGWTVIVASVVLTALTWAAALA